LFFNIKIFTFDLGALKTVKLPKPPLVKAGLRPVALLILPTAVFFVFEGVFDEVDDDWLGVSPVFFARRIEGRDGRTPP
jgi:hypothetical protein